MDTNKITFITYQQALLLLLVRIEVQHERQ